MVSLYGDVVYWLLRGLYVAIKACTKIILWLVLTKSLLEFLVQISGDGGRNGMESLIENETVMY